MPGYGPEPAEARFAGARELFAETAEWLSGQEAAGRES